VYGLLDSTWTIQPLESSSEYEPTSNRAQVRAAIAVLDMPLWREKGFHKLVIAMDSEYVINEVTKWSLDWKKNGWKMDDGGSVKDQDLWRILLEKIEQNDREGFTVQFLQLKRELNEIAAACAKKGAVSYTLHSKFTLNLVLVSIS
jgi:ribonuclease HI